MTEIFTPIDNTLIVVEAVCITVAAIVGFIPSKKRAVLVPKYVIVSIALLVLSVAAFVGWQKPGDLALPEADVASIDGEVQFTDIREYSHTRNNLPETRYDVVVAYRFKVDGGVHNGSGSGPAMTKLRTREEAENIVARLEKNGVIPVFYDTAKPSRHKLEHFETSSERLDFAFAHGLIFWIGICSAAGAVMYLVGAIKGKRF